MIALDAADDLLLLRPAERVVVVPDELDDGVVRLRPGIREEHMIQPLRRDRGQALGEVDGRSVALVREGVIEGQLAHLVGRRLHQPLLSESEGSAPEARHALDVLSPLAVGHVDAFALLDHQGAVGLVLDPVGVGVEDVGDVPHRQGIRPIAHRRRLLKNEVV